jgi:hypothetical protein
MYTISITFIMDVEYSLLSIGFDKPWLIISNKNDQKKKVVVDAEGQALARAGDRRAYVAVSLVDDTGLDEVGAYIFSTTSCFTIH